MTMNKTWQEKVVPGTATSAVQGIVPPIIYAYCRCPQCGALNSIVFRYPDVPATHKCAGCLQISPGEAYSVVIYTNQPLPPRNQALNNNPKTEVL